MVTGKKRLLVLLAGQSNMSGRAPVEEDDLMPVDGVSFICKKNLQWLPAVDPINLDRPGALGINDMECASPDPWDRIRLAKDKGKILGVGPGRTFGILMKHAYPDCEIGLVPVSIGGTPVSAWMRGGVDPHDPSNHPYDDAIQIAREALETGDFAAVLWHQGESDTQDCDWNRNYCEDLKRVIANFREDLPLESVPFIVGELGSYWQPQSRSRSIEEINKMILRAVKETPGLGWVSTADLNHKGDFMHFDTESSHALGRRYWREYCRMSGLPL